MKCACVFILFSIPLAKAVKMNSDRDERNPTKNKGCKTPLWTYIIIAILFIIIIILLCAIYAIARRKKKIGNRNGSGIEAQITEYIPENDYEEVVVPNNDYATPQFNTIIEKPYIKPKPNFSKVKPPRYLPMAPILNQFEIIPIKIKSTN